MGRFIRTQKRLIEYVLSEKFCTFVRCLRLLVIYIFFLHTVSCIWILACRIELQLNNTESLWIKDFNIDIDSRENLTFIYFKVFYLIISIMFTVG